MTIDVDAVWEYWTASQEASRDQRLAHERFATAPAVANNALWELVEGRDGRALQALTAVARQAPSEDGLAWLGAGQLESWLMNASEEDLVALRDAARQEPGIRAALRYSSMEDAQRDVLEAP